MTGRVLFALVVVLFACAPASAHTRSQSFSSWSVEGPKVIGVFQVDAQRVTQLSEEATFGSLDALLASHLAHTVSVTQAGKACVAHAPRPLVAARGDVRVEQVFACARPLAEAPAIVNMGAFFDVSPSHVHYARIAGPDGAREVLATVRSHSFEVGARAVASPTDFAAFFRVIERKFFNHN